MRKFIKIILITALMALFISPVSASSVRTIDDASILNASEEANLNIKLEELSNEYGFDFAILTSNLTIDNSVKEDALVMFKDAGFNEGVALYINTYTEEFYILTNGEDIDAAFDQNEKRLMLVAITEIYKNGGLDVYTKIAESFIRNAEFYYLDDENTIRDPLLVDEAGLFSESEIHELTNLLEEQSIIKNVDFVVYTTDTEPILEEKIEAADYYDYHNYSERGYMLYINMASRYLFILTTGEDIKTGFTQNNIDSMVSTIASNLTDENYYEAVTDFVDLFDKYYSPVEPGFDISKRDPLIIDKANVLNETTLVSLTTDLINKSSEYTFDICVYIDDDENVENAYSRAGEIYELLYYRYDGLMLYINVATSEVEIIRAGSMIYIYELDDFDEMLEELRELLAEAKYTEIISEYIDGSIDLYHQNLTEFEREETFDRIKTIVSVAFGISAVITVVIAVVLYRQTRSFRLQSNANNYATNEGSYFSKANIRVSQDIFLYRTRRRDYSPEQRNNSNSSSSFSGGGSSSFTGSSGESHGGGGGSF